VPILRGWARRATSSEEFVTQCAPPFGEYVIPFTMIKSIESRDFQFRIKNANEPHERVVKESQLNRIE
jgi:hypothetical protein